MAAESRGPMSQPDPSDEQRRSIVDYWNAIAICENLGGISGSLLRETEVEVTELLETGDPRNVYGAMRITAAFEYQRRLNS